MWCETAPPPAPKFSEYKILSLFEQSIKSTTKWASQTDECQWVLKVILLSVKLHPFECLLKNIIHINSILVSYFLIFCGCDVNSKTSVLF